MSTAEPICKTRVAVYVRIGRSNDHSTSFEMQRIHYEKFFKQKPSWELVEIYVDFGVSKRFHPKLNRLLFECKAGKVDLVVTKNATRFSMNVTSAIQIAKELRELKNPVGIYFEQENLTTFEEDNLFLLLMLEILAMEESKHKHERLPLSDEQRYFQSIKREQTNEQRQSEQKSYKRRKTRKSEAAVPKRNVRRSCYNPREAKS